MPIVAVAVYTLTAHFVEDRCCTSRVLRLPGVCRSGRLNSRAVSASTLVWASVVSQVGSLAVVAKETL